MPMLSGAQNRAMHAAAVGNSTIVIPQSVGRRFVADSHGQNVKRLPQHKKPAKKRAPVFVSLSPATQSGHYDGDMP